MKTLISDFPNHPEIDTSVRERANNGYPLNCRFSGSAICLLSIFRAVLLLVRKTPVQLELEYIIKQAKDKLLDFLI